MAKSTVLIPLLVLTPLLIGSENASVVDESVQLHGATVDGPDVFFQYSKDFSPCVHLFTEGWQRLGEGLLFCESGTEVGVFLDGDTLPLEGGMPLWLCHADNYSLCSEQISVEDITPLPVLNLHSLMLESGALRVVFDKDIDGCVALEDPDGNWVTDPGYFCDVGTDLTVVVPEDSLVIYPGVPLRLCPPGDGVCSQSVDVVEEVPEDEDNGSGCDEGGNLAGLMFIFMFPLFRRRKGHRVDAKVLVE